MGWAGERWFGLPANAAGVFYYLLVLPLIVIAIYLGQVEGQTTQPLISRS